MPFFQRIPAADFDLSPIKAMELEASRIPDVVSLAQGIPSFQTPEVIRSFVQDKIRAGVCDKYSLTTGLAELREEISLSLAADGLHYDPEREIIITAGAAEGVMAALLACTSPGDEVIVPSPTYVSYPRCLAIARCTPRYVHLDEDSNFDFQVAAIEKAISRNTRAIIYCSPNNPTGTIYSRQKTEAMVALALRHNIKIIIDEVYKDFYYTDDQHFSPASIPEARNHVVRVLSFSKAYAMTGWRIGFLHTDANTTARILKYHDAMVTCAPVVSQYAAIAALRYGAQAIESFRSEFRRRRDYTISRLDELSRFLDYQLPKAAYFAFPRIKDTVPLARQSKELALDILHSSHLAVVPGAAFGPAGECHLRLSFGRELPDLEEGLNRLTSYFDKTFTAKASLKQAGQSLSQTKARPASAWLKALARSAVKEAASTHIRRNKPLIIGIAGTTGKTVFKRSILTELQQQIPCRASILSWNTDIGLALSILDLEPPKSLSAAPSFAMQLLSQALSRRPRREVLILEYGVSNRKDAQALRRIAIPDYLILTAACNAGPGTDYKELQAALLELASGLQPGKILWNDQDPILHEISSNWLESGRLTLPSDPSLADAVGESARLAGVAARRMREVTGLGR